MATFKQTQIRGYQCTLIFVGSHYYLHNSFFGLLGQATRDYDKEGKYPDFTCHFTIEVGNHHCNWPSSMIASYFKRQIRLEERRHVAKEVTFDEKELDCTNKTLDIKMI